MDRVAIRGGGLLVLLASLAGAVTILALARTAQAAPQALAIRNVSITNVTDSGFSVSWVTDQPLPGSGSIVYGTSSSSVTVGAIELTPVPGSRGDVHSVSLRSLSPTTSYFFSVVDANVTDTNGGSYYRVTTGPSLQGSVSNHIASGQVLLSDGRTPAAGVLVIARVLDNAGLNGSAGPVTSAPLSSITGSQGTWSIPLIPRTADSANTFNYTSGGSDFLLLTVDGGSLGVVSPAMSVPISFDGNGKMTASSAILGAGTIPTDTPVSTSATSTATVTSSPTGAAGTTTVVATASTVTGSTPAVASSPLVTPTGQHAVVPTVAPVPTEVQPPPPLTPTSALPVVAAPTPATVYPTTVIEAGQPAAAQAPSAPSTPVALSGSSGVQVPPIVPARSPRALASSVVASPSPRGASDETEPPKGKTADPLKSIELVALSGIGLIGLGLVVSAVGFAAQRRDG